MIPNAARGDAAALHAAALQAPIDPPLSRARFAVWLVAVVALAALLRGIFPTADPPSRPTVGVVWHDEGAWVHNARNGALFGTWRTDEWNPMYISPVLTGLEYASFRAFGVGLRQARLVSQVAGTLSVLLLGLGVARLGGRRAGLVAAAFMAVNYVYVMYDRAALMEATMVALLVAAWYAYVRAFERPRWGLAAGPAAILAFFTKASAAFFLAALALDALIVLAIPEVASRDGRGLSSGRRSSPDQRAAALYTLGGLAGAGLAGLLLFVLPHWAEYRFYNWQMSVTRRPSYTVRALMDRVSWFPIVHDFFTRMWATTLLGAAAVLGVVADLRRRHPGERLLVIWLGLGVLELVARDVGNERYFVFLVPAMAAVTALLLVRDRRLLPLDIAGISRRRGLLAAPLVLFALYVVAGALVRLPFLYEVRPGVRLAAAVASAVGVFVYVTWPRVPRWLARDRWSLGVAVAVVVLIVAGDLAQFGQWAAGRSYKNYAAMKRVAERLPPGTLVHGKLANGLSLESRIHPVFVGRNFGNYADRLARDDIRYLLTYISPSLGYEGPVIREVLDQYPGWRVLETFEVSESPGGRDEAALVDKIPPATR